MYNAETVESLLAYPGRHSRPVHSSTGFRRSSVRTLVRKVRKTA
ncbi:MAG: hypothetical protein JWN77_156 [Frankiales bacterium]|jgi:hypothetical protein|nr:hypothetical protein [Frankiales bacterium]